MRHDISRSAKRIRRATIRTNLKRVRSVEHDRRTLFVWGVTFGAIAFGAAVRAPLWATFTPITIATLTTIALDIVYARRLNAELRAIDEGSREARGATDA